MPAAKRTTKRRTTSKAAASRKRTTKNKSWVNNLTSKLNNRTYLFLALFIVVGAFVAYKFSMAATPVPRGDVKGVGSLIFEDNFEGSSLNTSVWQPNWFGRDDRSVSESVNSAETACYDPNQISVSGGMLNLRVDRNTSSDCKYKSNSSKAGQTAPYRAALMRTKRQDFGYGYYEARMYIPGSGSRGYNWPAFWTNGQNHPRDGEIDIMEILGGEACWNYHWQSSGRYRQTDSTCPLTDLRMGDNNGWHTFGVKRERGKLTYYYDGREVGTHTEGVVDSPHYLIVNNTTGDYGGQSNAPQTVQVDYVRVWSLGSGSGDGNTGGGSSGGGGNSGGGSTSNQAPNVSLGRVNSTYDAPANVTFTATASDADGRVAKVEFYRGSTKMGEATREPYRYTWSNISPGTYTVTARATDDKGATTTSNERTFTVRSATGAPSPSPDPDPGSGSGSSGGNGYPTVTFGKLNSSYTAPATVKITVDAKDSDGMDRVSFYDDKHNWLGTDEHAPYEVSMNRLRAGTYSVYVRATDNKGNTTTSDKVTFKVVEGSSSGRDRGGRGGRGGGGSSDDSSSSTGSRDTQAPSVPTNLTRSLNVEWLSYVLRLNWKASSDNVGVEDYVVNINSPYGNKTDTTKSTSYGFTEMRAGARYDISVRARDKAGNVSGDAKTSATAQCFWIFCALK